MAPQIAPHPVQTPITDGVRFVNFFNGRLLTAEDLRREQEANLVLRDRLGLAVGDGVVRGLRVGQPGPPVTGDPSRPVVRVSAGVAVSRRGHALCLASDVDLSLARPPGSGSTTTSATSSGRACESPAKPGEFASCSGIPPGAPLVAAGIYLLTVGPASRAVGRAQVSGLGNVVSRCGVDASAEGVAFRIVRLEVPATLFGDQAKTRSRLAHLMFGTEDEARHRIELDPFGTTPGHGGLLERLRDAVLVDDEVPLACLHWVPGQGIRFVDEWSVRRTVCDQGAAADRPDVTGRRSRVVGEAAFQQFQAQLVDLLPRTGSYRRPAAEVFDHLPAAGLLPVSSAPGSRVGVVYQDFFRGTPVHGPFVIDGTHVASCLEESFLHSAVDLRTTEVVRLYRVRQNLLPGADGDTRPPFLIFTSAHLTYQADGRFDLGRWNYSHFAEGT